MSFGRSLNLAARAAAAGPAKRLHAPVPAKGSFTKARPRPTLHMRRMGAGKLAGLDKKLSKSLDQEVQTGSSPLELSRSPLGPLAESSR